MNSDNAKAFFDALRRLMAAHKVRFSSFEDSDRPQWCIRMQDDFSVSIGSLVDMMAAAPNEQVENVQDTGDAVKTISDAMRKDPAYAWTWHCSLACCAFDEGVDIIRANNIAARFMAMAFSIVRAQYDPEMTKENTP